MSYNNNFNRHNSIGANWNLPPITGFTGSNSSNGSNDDEQSLPLQQSTSQGNQGQGQTLPQDLQTSMTGFRNPWYYSNGTNSSPNTTKSSTIPLLQQQQPNKRLSFANQLPVTYEDDSTGSSRNPGNFIHPPTRAANPFNQYYTNQDVTLLGPERRMSTAADTYTGSYQLNAPPNQGVTYNQLDNAGRTNNSNNFKSNRRSSVAVGGLPQYGYNQYYDSSAPDVGLGGPSSGIGGFNQFNHHYNNHFPPYNQHTPPINFRGGRSQSVVQYNQYQQGLQNQRLTKKRKPAPKLTKVFNRLDLKPKVHNQPKYRRCSVNSIHISPVNALSVYLTETYGICQPKKFQYSRSTNPKRVLTKPSDPKYNNGYDNEDSDYILYVNDILGTEEGRKYIVLDLLGSGTFGQVVKCQNLSNQSVVAVKVIKSKPAYINQSLTEVRLLEYLSAHSNGKNFIRLLDTFMHKEHLCLTFELLASNLYELVKQNQFQGLNMKLVKILTRQLLESMAELKSFQIIHCDLKPENILLCQPDKPEIKVIDFGSACFTRETIYSYIQSRFYRSPEVLLGLPYTESIDMWSVGCIVGELFLGLPLFPGTSEYNQLWKIVDMLGYPPRHMLEVGKNTLHFFKKIEAQPGTKPTFEIKGYDEYLEFLSRKNKDDKAKAEQPNKNYFKHKHLKDIILHYKLPSKKMTNTMIEKECDERLLLVDFLTKVLSMNPLERLTPQEALKHPFIRER